MQPVLFSQEERTLLFSWQKFTFQNSVFHPKVKTEIKLPGQACKFVQSLFKPP